MGLADSDGEQERAVSSLLALVARKVMGSSKHQELRAIALKSSAANIMGAAFFLFIIYT